MTPRSAGQPLPPTPWPDDDEGKAITVRVSFTDDRGNEETLTSAATEAVAAAAPPPNTPATGAPTISGAAQVGETLTATSSGIADADGMDRRNLQLPVGGRRTPRSAGQPLPPTPWWMRRGQGQSRCR